MKITVIACLIYRVNCVGGMITALALHQEIANQNNMKTHSMTHRPAQLGNHVLATISMKDLIAILRTIRPRNHGRVSTSNRQKHLVARRSGKNTRRVRHQNPGQLLRKMQAKVKTYRSK